jgi:hypothetical protein
MHASPVQKHGIIEVLDLSFGKYRSTVVASYVAPRGAIFLCAQTKKQTKISKKTIDNSCIFSLNKGEK